MNLKLNTTMYTIVSWSLMLHIFFQFLSTSGTTMTNIQYVYAIKCPWFLTWTVKHEWHPITAHSHQINKIFFAMVAEGGSRH